MDQRSVGTAGIHGAASKSRQSIIVMWQSSKSQMTITDLAWPQVSLTNKLGGTCNLLREGSYKRSNEMRYFTAQCSSLVLK